MAGTGICNGMDWLWTGRSGRPAAVGESYTITSDGRAGA